MLKIAISPHVKRLIGRLRDEGCRNESDIIAQQKHQLVSPKWRLGNCVLVRFIGGHCPLVCPFCVSTAPVRNIRPLGFIALTDHVVVCTRNSSSTVDFPGTTETLRCSFPRGISSRKIVRTDSHTTQIARTILNAPV